MAATIDLNKPLTLRNPKRKTIRERTAAMMAPDSVSIEPGEAQLGDDVVTKDADGNAEHRFTVAQLLAWVGIALSVLLVAAVIIIGVLIVKISDQHDTINNLQGTVNTQNGVINNQSTRISNLGTRVNNQQISINQLQSTVNLLLEKR